MSMWATKCLALAWRYSYRQCLFDGPQHENEPKNHPLSLFPTQGSLKAGKDQALSITIDAYLNKRENPIQMSVELGII